MFICVGVHLGPDTLFAYQAEKRGSIDTVVKPLANYSNGGWTSFQTWKSRLPDNGHELNTKLIFADTPSRKEDYGTVELQ